MLEAMEITSDTTRIRLVAFQLEGEAQVWWNWDKTSRDLEATTWAEFHDLFMCKYFSNTARHAKAQEFLELKQGTMTVLEYVARFMELAHFADDYVAMDMAKVRRFENGLKLSIRGRIVGLRLHDIDAMVGTALTIEREIEDAQSTRDASVSGKRPSGPVTNQGYQSGWADGVLPLPTARTYEKRLPLETRISGFWESAVPVSGGTGEDTVYSSTAQYRTEEPVSVSRSCTRTSLYAGRPKTSRVQGRVYAITPPAESAN